ncbi:MAG: hypothetical protein WCA28_26000, partial [Bradyrhizobium sp.]
NGCDTGRSGQAARAEEAAASGSIEYAVGAGFFQLRQRAKEAGSAGAAYPLGRSAAPAGQRWTLGMGARLLRAITA